jgi:protein O-mannosyl-transferase
MKPSRSTFVCFLLIILVITFVSFYPSLNNGFTNWDDQHHIVDNSSIKVLTWKSITELPASFLMSNYIPLTALTYMIEYRFFRLNPFVYHATNLFLHLLNCILVFWFVYLISSRTLVAFIASLFFGIHPLHVESVAWISERKDVLYALFFLASLICYTYYLKKAFSLKYFYLSIAFFLLSLLSKPMAVSLPLLLFVVDYVSSRQFSRRALLEKLPFLILAGVFSMVTFYAQESAITHRMIFMFPDNIIYFCYRLVFYLEKILLPVGLSSFYPYPDRINGGLPAIYLFAPAILLCALIGLIFFLRFVKYNRLIVFGILFFVVNMLPVLQIVPAGQAIVADRYVYLSYVGIFIILGYGLSVVLAYKKSTSAIKIILAIVLVCWLCTFSFVTQQRCLIWKDSITLWSNVLERYPGNAVAYNNRGSAHFEVERYGEAIDDFHMALRTSPDDAGSYNNLCRSYLKMNKQEQAFASCKRAIMLKPDYVEAYNNLGSVYHSAGRTREAMDLYRKAVQLRPDYPPAFNNLCVLYKSIGNQEQAFASCKRAIMLKPDYAEAYNNLGSLYYSKGKNQNALDNYKEALKLNPSYAPAHNDLAVLYYYQKQYELALKHYKKAVQLGHKVHPGFANLVSTLSAH